ncbi:MAG: S-layer homology domain-containing protein [Lachnospiraceae bacterium]|nr:S-layer homology domain-containing protein [Lachnospiraceae bacterium]
MNYNKSRIFRGILTALLLSIVTAGPVFAEESASASDTEEASSAAASTSVSDAEEAASSSASTSDAEEASSAAASTSVSDAEEAASSSTSASDAEEAASSSASDMEAAASAVSDSEEMATGYHELPFDEDVPSVTEDEDYHTKGMLRLRAAASDTVYNPLSGSDTGKYLPAIRNQNPYGNCWAFGSVALIEMSLLHQDYAAYQGIDLSELQLSYFTLFQNIGSAVDPLGGTSGDTTTCLTPISSGGFLKAGANFGMAGQTLANWVAVADDSGALVTTEENETSVLNSSLDTSYQYYSSNKAYVGDIYSLDISTDRALAKSYIVSNGGIGISFYAVPSMTNAYYNSSTNAYYYSTATTVRNHAVTIVGWDDSFSKSNFNTEPSGDGAWLVRNSWGREGYSYGGYFWLSYYDLGLNPKGMVFIASPAGEEDHNYQYDGNTFFGVHNGAGGSGSITAANVFTAKGNSDGEESLDAVSFETASTVNTGYKVQIYKNLTDPADPESGALQSTATTEGSTTCTGYYTVRLNAPVTLAEGDTFAVVVTLSKDSGSVYFATEYNYSSSGWIEMDKAASSGQSFLKSDGTWSDYGSSHSGNIRIKAFTNDIAAIPLQSISLDKSEMSLLTGKSEVLTVSYDPENTTSSKSVTWESSDPKVASVTDGTVRGIGAGTAVVTATCQGHSAVCTVMVTEDFPFTDVSSDPSNWKHQAVLYVYENGLLLGTGTTTFSPEENLTRGMFTSILYRIEGRPDIAYSPVFTDVPDNGAYYVKPVLWAASEKIVYGYAGGSFGPADPITREQLLQILYRYAVNYKGYTTGTAGDLSGYPDAGKVSKYAVTAMKWAIGNGIISGTVKNGTYYLSPKEDVTRVVCAKIIKTFGEKYGM